ncbi:MAG: twitching motility protein PilT [Betaproteobacteria bacterium RIFCSPLOWO2_12_FULL_62_58]|nr:MAG: twitching motility protein PilT [Betaproteobacteria bacterium RIFCSPLOWO2_12_FULL_62_58]
MRLLLDTHLLLWAAASSKRLPGEARTLVEDAANEVFFSAASIWEIAIKSSLGRTDFRIDLAALQSALPRMGLTELPVSAAHAIGVTKLPPIHRDPFDRLLIAQSIAEPLTLLTNDALLARYWDGVRVV